MHEFVNESCAILFEFTFHDHTIRILSLENKL